ncbi:RYK receptor-like tyrosine kinase [Paragonimus westermani]|uniref:RYK receptor-like tyrosine kinase n=1 Tax=Paragonimus westermani TaxID=34504 RepID=A0A5J4P3P3_9TREM|nr:RYK receptor-like tyrosine kinase [Paragonimus westermani]
MTSENILILRFSLKESAQLLQFPRLGANYSLKLSDCALSRDFFPDDYHCLGDNTNRPIKWLALEALIERKYTVATDVWSMGVTLWELITKGQQPYDLFDSFEMLNVLRSGYRMKQPFHCPDEL